MLPKAWILANITRYDELMGTNTRVDRDRLQDEKYKGTSVCRVGVVGGLIGC